MPGSGVTRADAPRTRRRRRHRLTAAAAAATGVAAALMLPSDVADGGLVGGHAVAIQADATGWGFHLRTRVHFPEHRTVLAGAFTVGRVTDGVDFYRNDLADIDGPYPPIWYSLPDRHT